MKNQLDALSANDKELLLKAPALVSILAASTDEKMDKQEKADAIELSHLRTYTSEPELREYYKEVEKIFKSQLENLIKQYSPIKDAQQKELQAELESVNSVINKLDKKYADLLKISLNSYAKHVGDIHWNFLDYIVFPISIPGLTE